MGKLLSGATFMNDMMILEAKVSRREAEVGLLCQVVIKVMHIFLYYTVLSFYENYTTWIDFFITLK